jgi:hypothetical protein
MESMHPIIFMFLMGCTITCLATLPAYCHSVAYISYICYSSDMAYANMRSRVMEGCRDGAAGGHLPPGWCDAWCTPHRHHQSLGEIPVTWYTRQEACWNSAKGHNISSGSRFRHSGTLCKVFDGNLSSK